MSIEEFIQKDNTFSENSFIAKVDNTFIMLLTAIMTDNLQRVEHKISSELFKHYSNVISQLNANNERQLYDELNVKKTSIEKIEQVENKYRIYVLLTSRYMDYRVNKTTGNFKSGNNTSRIEKDFYLTFEKNINVKNEQNAKKCPGCGANIDVNFSGKCDYCGAIYDTENYGWILTSIH